MNVRFLETFLWVARLQSFSGAAEKLHTTQAAVSSRIATLERDLGVRLFDRDLRSVRLTPEGRHAVEQAQAIVRLTAEFRETVGSRSALRGVVRIGSSDTIAYSWLPELIARMQARYPSVSLDVNIDTSLNLARQIQDGEIDLGIIMGPVVAPGIRSVEACTFASCWVASASLGIGEGPLDLAELDAYPLLTFSTGSAPHRALLDHLSKAGLESFRVYNSNSLAVMTRLVSAGVGIGALPVVLVQDLVREGRARILDIQPPVPSLTFHVVHQDRSDDILAKVITDMALQIAADARAANRQAYA
ncbi:LysR family transcriptional regulator [Aureimonas populi]|uniref:LysR family transcriptional regulator n=1 Tax=Aureimonas populi TaxID=1701758 RepID=A0ABW5CIV9_9HYPH|nr:LysR family transcriptional regulator [Aureimonas populi]